MRFKNYFSVIIVIVTLILCMHLRHSDLIISLFIFLLIYRFFHSNGQALLTKINENIGRIYTIILVLALVLRVGWALFSGVEQTSDFKDYLDMGREISRGEYFFTSLKQTGPSLIVGLVFWSTGIESVSLVLIIIALTSFLQVPLTYYVAKSLFTPAIGIIAALIASIWPESLLYVNLVGNEVFIATSFLAAWCCILKWLEKTGSPKYLGLIAGLLLGFSQYMRGSGLIVFCAFLIVLILFYRRKAISFIIFYIVGFVAATLPLLIYNQTELGVFSFSPSQMSGNNLVIGADSAKKGHYYDTSDEVREYLLELKEKGEIRNLDIGPVEKNRLLKELGVAKIKKDLYGFTINAIFYKFPVLWGKPGGFIWSLDTSRFADYKKSITYVSSMIHLLAIFGCALTLMHALRNEEFHFHKKYLVFFSGIVALTLLHMVVEVQPKYHHGFVTIIPIICAGWLKYVIPKPSKL